MARRRTILIVTKLPNIAREAVSDVVMCENYNAIVCVELSRVASLAESMLRSIGCLVRAAISNAKRDVVNEELHHLCSNFLTCTFQLDISYRRWNQTDRRTFQPHISHSLQYRRALIHQNCRNYFWTPLGSPRKRHGGWGQWLGQRCTYPPCRLSSSRGRYGH